MGRQFQGGGANFTAIFRTYLPGNFFDKPLGGKLCPVTSFLRNATAVKGRIKLPVCTFVPTI
jgi:hypothetical protein